MTARRLEKLIICAVALHSLVLGAAMLTYPCWVLRMVGWDYEGPPFFPAQSGLFLLILGGAYVAGIWQRCFAGLLVTSKAAAVVFLVAQYAFGNGPLILILAACLDGLMGAAVAAVVTCNTRPRRECEA